MLNDRYFELKNIKNGYMHVLKENVVKSYQFFQKLNFHLFFKKCLWFLIIVLNIYLSIFIKSKNILIFNCKNQKIIKNVSVRWKRRCQRRGRNFQNSLINFWQYWSRRWNWFILRADWSRIICLNLWNHVPIFVRTNCSNIRNSRNLTRRKNASPFGFISRKHSQNGLISHQR